ncbi:MAG: TldD/PmbA family protein [Elusimicrobia bacterium]|nr:TldD/PmbA family protein [Elusimicrobiota bacterium]
MTEHKKMCEKIFSLAGACQAEAIITSSDSALTRFAGNVISQNVADTSTEISVRIISAGRVARFSLNQPSEKALKEGFAAALEALKTQKKDPALESLPKGAPVKENKKLFFKGTAELSPSYRAVKIGALVNKCKKAGITAYGTFENGAARTTVANNRGVFASHLESSAVYSVTARDKDGFGWAETAAFDAGDINFDRVDGTAMEKARLAKNPRSIPPGRYTVILEPSAAASLLSYLGIYGFGGQFYNEGQSFVSGKLGKKAVSELLTMRDDALDGPAAGMPFDYEGRPRKKVILIKKGLAAAVVHDRHTAAKAGTRTTGHALPLPNTHGPLPLNLTVEKGDASLAGMIKSTKKGILVTQFHYTNLLKPLTVEMTGMTRNGTFMIENGRVAYGIKNLRFTESAVEALNRVQAVGDKPELCLAWGRFSAPALKLTDFNFSSATEF